MTLFLLDNSKQKKTLIRFLTDQKRIPPNKRSLPSSSSTSFPPSPSHTHTASLQMDRCENWSERREKRRKKPFAKTGWGIFFRVQYVCVATIFSFSFAPCLPGQTGNQRTRRGPRSAWEDEGRAWRCRYIFFPSQLHSFSSIRPEIYCCSWSMRKKDGGGGGMEGGNKPEENP